MAKKKNANATKLSAKEAAKLLDDIGTGKEAIIPRHAMKQETKKPAKPKAKKKTK